MDSWIKQCDDKIKEKKSSNTNNNTSHTNSSNKSEQASSSSSSHTSTTNRRQTNATASFLNVSSSKELTFASDGGSKTIVVYCDAEWQVDVGTLYWSKLRKSGNQITLTVEPNNQVEERTDYFVLKSGEKTCRVNIKQYGRIPYLSVSSTSLEYLTEGGRQTIHVTANCEWKVSVPPAYWVQLTKSGNDI
jgi:hypothetical protein